MPTPPIVFTDLIQVTVNQLLADREVTNTFWCFNDGPDSFDAVVPGIEDAFDAFFGAIKTELSTTWSVVTYTIRNRSSLTGAVHEASPAASIVGDDAGAILPRQTALVMSLRTGFAGPRRRGRSYLTGFTEDKNGAGGVPDATMRGVIETAASTLIDDLSINDTPLQVFSRGWEDDPDPAKNFPASVANVTSITVDSRWDTQRRRAR